ncbi:MAG TPA: Trk family potassium uptake protein, partial [Eubacteriaceae bacterium]|nr:Trk family potassium uptake protein [Eubacteriaceae bacterium]
MKSQTQRWIHKFIKRDAIKPPQILVLGFAFTILLGTFLLNTDYATQAAGPPGFLTALFTATSAVCVTGLVVVDTGTFWSVAGQNIILALIQIGGLGFMSMTTLIFLVMGKRITIKERMIIKDSLNYNSLEGIIRFVRYILVFTFSIEFIGAVLLSFSFIPAFGVGTGIRRSIFHSISAFCNAGFDIMGGGKSLTAFVDDPIVNLSVMMLIILGGIGFSVFRDVVEKRNFKRFQLHTKVVLTMSGFLIIFGAGLVFLLEYNNQLADLNWGSKVMASFFQSVTARTAGFNTINTGMIEGGTLSLVMVLMFVGGSPGSTAGGVKTTTLGTIVFTVLSVFKGRDETEIFHRTISRNVVRRATSLIF